MEQTVDQYFSIFFPLFWVLFGSVLVWFVLVSRLYKILANEHPRKYEEMGKPTLFWNNSPKSGWVLMKFILKKEYRELKNPKLTGLGNFMFGFSVAYFVLFGSLLVLFFSAIVNVQIPKTP